MIRLSSSFRRWFNAEMTKLRAVPMPLFEAEAAKILPVAEFAGASRRSGGSAQRGRGGRFLRRTERQKIGNSLPSHHAHNLPMDRKRLSSVFVCEAREVLLKHSFLDPGHLFSLLGLVGNLPRVANEGAGVLPSPHL